MKRGHIAVALATLLALTVFAMAAELRAGQNASINSNERITTNAYLAGSTVASSGSVSGDLVAAGGTIIVTGPVSKSILAAGGTINILSTVGESVRVGGGNVMINGKVGGDVVVGGGQVSIEGTGVGGDVIVGGGTVRIDAPVTGDVRVASGQLIINAPISGTVHFRGNTLELGSNALVHGNLDYSASKEATIAQGASVQGKTNFTPTPKSERPAEGAAVIATVITLALVAKFLMTLVCALVLGLIFHRFALSLVLSVSDNGLTQLGRGFATIVLLPIASVILLFTVIGVPIGILGFLVFAILCIFGVIVSPIVIGSFVFKWFGKPSYEVTWLTILVGAIIYGLLTFIPVIGWLAKFVIVLMSIGAIVQKFGVARDWR